MRRRFPFEGGYSPVVQDVSHHIYPAASSWIGAIAVDAVCFRTKNAIIAPIRSLRGSRTHRSR